VINLVGVSKNNLPLCDYGCGEFKNIDALNRHMRRKHGEDLNPCWPGILKEAKHSN
jgi:hypothetical protein